MIGQLIGAGLGLASGVAGLIGGGKAAKRAKSEMDRLGSMEPKAETDPFYAQNIAAAGAAGQEQMKYANQLAGMGTAFSKDIAAQQSQFGQSFQSTAERGARQTERLGQMAFQRGLGAAGVMGMDALAQSGATAMRGASDRRMGAGMAGALGRSQMQGINQLVGQGYQAQTQGLGALMGAQQQAANARLNALGTVYQTGLQARQLGFGAETAGVQGQQQAGLTGFQLGSQAGLQMAGANERTAQAKWESWANKYQNARGDLAAANAQKSAGWGAIAGAAGSFLGSGALGGLGGAAKSASSAASGLNLNSFASGQNPAAFGTNFMKFK